MNKMMDNITTTFFIIIMAIIGIFTAGLIANSGGIAIFGFCILGILLWLCIRTTEELGK